MMDWTTIILAVLTLLGGCGWLVDHKSHKAKIEGLKKDNEQKDMQLAKTYVDEFRENVAKPLQTEVKGLRRNVKQLTNAVEKINDCDYRSQCPVRIELQKQPADSRNAEDC